MATKADPELQADFIKEVRILHRQKNVDLWFYDESAALGDPTPYLVLAHKGSRPTVPYQGNRLRITMAGAVRPSDGYLFSLLLSTGNTDLFQVFINEFHHHINRKKRNILVLDNASFHHSKSLDWGIIEPKFLPPYSPVLNPIEQLWLRLKKKFFNQWIAKEQNELENRTVKALNYYMDRPEMLVSTCAMSAYL